MQQGAGGRGRQLIADQEMRDTDDERHRREGPEQPVVGQPGGLERQHLVAEGETGERQQRRQQRADRRHDGGDLRRVEHRVAQEGAEARAVQLDDVVGIGEQVEQLQEADEGQQHEPHVGAELARDIAAQRRHQMPLSARRRRSRFGRSFIESSRAATGWSPGRWQAM